MNGPRAPALSAALAARFADDGFLVVPGALSPAVLESLRAEADAAVIEEDARLARGEPVSSEITRRGRRYYVAGRAASRPVLRRYALGPLMEELCRRLLGPDAYLFIDVVVTKMPGDQGMAWHQDFGYLDYYGFGHYQPNLSVWAALDDVSADNGALRVLPFSAGGVCEKRTHHPAGATGDKTADFGGHAGVLLPVPAGSLIVLSGLVPHASGGNHTARPRRAYLLQFSPAPVVGPEGSIQLALPLLVNGVRQEPLPETVPEPGPGRGAFGP